MIAPRPEDTEDVATAEIGSALRGGEVVDLITALRRQRPQTQWGYVHVGPAVLEEAADRIERLTADLGDWLRSEEASEIAIAAICRPGPAGGMIGRANSVLAALADAVPTELKGRS